MLTNITHACMRISLDSVAVCLVGSNSHSEGRLEVLYSGKWGSVCSDSFTIVEANVVCHQLGYPGAVAYYNDTHFGQGNGKSL